MEINKPQKICPYQKAKTMVETGVFNMPLILNITYILPLVKLPYFRPGPTSKLWLIWAFNFNPL